MKVFLIAGEASGDVIGAKLVQALQTQESGELEIMGIGGPLMIKAGLKCLLPMDQLSLMGIVEILPKLPQLYKIYKATLDKIEKNNPDIVVTIDAPEFNFRIAKALKSRGIFKGKIIHYVAPTVWAWRPKRAKKIARFLDGLICLYPFEPPFFTEHKLKTISAGHPMIEVPINLGDGAGFRKQHKIPENAKTLGVFFGSREGELARLSETLLESVRLLSAQCNQDIHLIVPTLPKLEPAVRDLVSALDVPVHIVSAHDEKPAAIAACDVALAVSGTVGLELAYNGIPHVIAYKMAPLSWMILRLIIKVRHAHLANIMMKKEIVPEFLQGQCTPLNISSALKSFINDEKVGALQKEEFNALRTLMIGQEGDFSPSMKAASFILKAVSAKN